MQHRSFAQTCSRVVTGVVVSVLMTAAAGAFADEASNSSTSTVSWLPASFQAESTSLSPDASSSTGSAAGTGVGKSFLSGMAGKASDVVVGALNMIGVRYRWGGFVRYVFQDTLGLALPRRSEEMSRVGEKVRISDLKPGDLVFFNTMRRTFSHVGIYIGGNKFVHSPSTGSTIRVDNLDDRYWETRFNGGRRVETSFSGKADELRQRVSTTIDTKQGN
jgi:cell wall-associated NlpC family hydrolase